MPRDRGSPHQQEGGCTKTVLHLPVPQELAGQAARLPDSRLVNRIAAAIRRHEIKRSYARKGQTERFARCV